MGTFLGHALPGTLFIMFGFWWSVDCLNHYFKIISQRKSANLNSIEYKFDFSNCRNRLLQGVSVLALTSFGIIGEYVTAFDKGPVMCKDNLQHMTMYSFFFLYGLSQLLTYFESPIPPDSEHFTVTLAFFMESLLFYFHLHGRSHLDVHVHTLLIVATAFCTLACCYEWKYKDSLLASIGRPFGCLIQGTWFWQVGFILYNPLPGADMWKSHDHEQIMVITSLFCWHVAANVLILTVLCLRFHRKYKNIWSVGSDVSVVSRTSAKYRQLNTKESNVCTDY
ncbi:transmembrane protein 45B-like protein [Dinothrombium tinctorium]|uniref:Transmembrane protein 45B-like protein n=1 Tax=Dinothrombium tinctorium TaxID=1965070 RepID=A0A3S3NKD7_9ACAR|nr:transmembrane protein 45B-like protein [Dinothrombium tinctorium]